MTQDRGSFDLKQISEDDARAQLKETYADPEAAGRFFDQLIETRRAAIDRFTEELNGDEGLATHFARDPVGLLGRRKLLGPLDRLTLEGLRNPFLDFPWPWPICRLVCRVESWVEVEWVCIGFWPIRLCWPVLHIRWRWVCRIVCE
jgi:hypothetical protein